MVGYYNLRCFSLLWFAIFTAQNVLSDENTLVNPGQPKVSFYSSRLAVITWEKSVYTKDNGLVYNFQKRENDGEWKNLPPVIAKDNSQPTAMVILKPYTKYSFRVRALNIYDDTPYSEASEPIISHAEIPEKEPEDLTALHVSDSSITVQWSPPDKDSIHGKFTGYELQYNSKGMPAETIRFDLPNLNTSSYFIENLIPNTTYKITIRVVNHVGKGPAATINITTKEEEVPPTEPLYFTVAAISSTRIHLEWIHPEFPKRPVDHYELNVESLGSRKTYLIYDKNNTVEYVLKNLTPSTKYTMWITAYSSSQRGPPSLKLSVKTDAQDSQRSSMKMKSPTSVQERCNRLCRQCFMCAVIEPLQKNREDVYEISQEKLARAMETPPRAS